MCTHERNIRIAFTNRIESCMVHMDVQSFAKALSELRVEGLGAGWDVIETRQKQIARREQ